VIEALIVGVPVICAWLLYLYAAWAISEVCDKLDKQTLTAIERRGQRRNGQAIISAGDRCVICGTYIPEGRQVCVLCIDEYSQDKGNP
jgi:hypothetical protein